MLIHCHNPTQLNPKLGRPYFPIKPKPKPKPHRTEPSVTFSQLLDNQTQPNSGCNLVSTKLKDSCNGRRPQKFQNGRRPQKFQNGRRPQKFQNGRRAQKNSKWKTKSKTQTGVGIIITKKQTKPNQTTTPPPPPHRVLHEFFTQSYPK